MKREFAALIIGNEECFVGTVFQADDGTLEAIGTNRSMDLPAEIQQSRHFQNITKKEHDGKLKGRRIWVLSHYENSALTTMMRGMHK